jgi:hypothetical protein
MITCVFIVLPTLQRKFVNRAHRDLNDFDTFYAHDNFAGFPVLSHHAHPYLVIVNALPKLKAHVKSLTEEQTEIHSLMKFIATLWDLKSPKPTSLHPSGCKRRRGDSDEGSADEEGGGGSDRGKSKGKAPRRDSNPSEKGREGSGATEAGGGTGSKGKGKQRKKPDVPKVSCQPLQASYPSPPHSPRLESANTGNDNASYYDNKANVLTWIDTVIKTGPPDKVPSDVIKVDGEHAHAMFEGNWHDWCFPWVHPPDASQFTSNDWAMKRFLCKLTRAPGIWESSDEEDTSNSSLDNGGCKSLRSFTPVRALNSRG